MDTIAPIPTLTITNVLVFPVREPSGKLLAIARVLLGGQLQLADLRLYGGPNGPFVSYPSSNAVAREDAHQVVYPVTRDLRTAIELAVIAEYHLAMAR
jgi:DNA-binding cell septation regulator SpoVG